jgi:ABC-type uncharacterized transport system ATPase subunit
VIGVGVVVAGLGVRGPDVMCVGVGRRVGPDVRCVGVGMNAAFALLAWRRPHIVVLDEPTNHLDMDTIEALIDAVRQRGNHSALSSTADYA